MVVVVVKTGQGRERHKILNSAESMCGLDRREGFALSGRREDRSRRVGTRRGILIIEKSVIE